MLHKLILRVGLLITWFVADPSLCEEEYRFNCRPKPGCDFSMCDPAPSGWSEPGFDIDFYLRRNDYHLTCEPQNASKLKGSLHEVAVLREEVERSKIAINQLVRKVAKMNQKIEELSTRCGEKDEKCMKSFPEGLCDILYKGKCFWMVYDGYGVNFTQASTICRKRNGAPANIYHEKHWEVIEELVRLKIPSFLSFHTLWTGMKFYPKTRTTTLSDGTASSFQVWYPGTPHASPQNTQIIIWIDKNPQAANQGMWDYNPTSIHHGVLCQLC